MEEDITQADIYSDKTRQPISDEVLPTRDTTHYTKTLIKLLNIRVNFLRNHQANITDADLSQDEQIMGINLALEEIDKSKPPILAHNIFSRQASAYAEQANNPVYAPARDDLLERGHQFEMLSKEIEQVYGVFASNNSHSVNISNTSSQEILS